MASVSNLNTRSKSLDSSNDFMRARNIRVPASASPSAGESWKGTAAASGPNPAPVRDQLFTSRCRDGSHECFPIMLVEDNRAYVFLMREALEAAEIAARVHVVSDGEMAIRYIDELNAANDSGNCPALVLLDLNLPKISG